MTLVWNQRTTLENEGGGGKRTFKEEPLARVNQQARGAGTLGAGHAHKGACTSELQPPLPSKQSVEVTCSKIAFCLFLLFFAVWSQTVLISFLQVEPEIQIPNIPNVSGWIWENICEIQAVCVCVTSRDHAAQNDSWSAVLGLISVSLCVRFALLSHEIKTKIDHYDTSCVTLGYFWSIIISAFQADLCSFVFHWLV